MHESDDKVAIRFSRQDLDLLEDLLGRAPSSQCRDDLLRKVTHHLTWRDITDSGKREVGTSFVLAWVASIEGSYMANVGAKHKQPGCATSTMWSKSGFATKTEAKYAAEKALNSILATAKQVLRGV